MMSKISAFFRRLRLTHWLILFGLAAVLVLWLAISPPGLMGKADAIGYAVCHRIADRSFFFVDRQMPLCSRCTGTFTAALLSLIYLLSTGKRAAGLPPLKFTLIFVAFLVVFGIDGINSSLHLFPGIPGIYEPHNWLRLVTGSAVGVALPAYLLPVFNLTAWAESENRPMLSSWKEFGILLLLAGALDISVLSENPLLLYPIALLGAGGVLALFTVIFTSLWLMLLHKEQIYQSWRGLIFPLLGGFATTFLLVLGMDIFRLALTHTWEGFPLPW